MNNPQFKIHGSARRDLKKELNQLKHFVKYYWHYHQLDKDMASFYGGTSNYPMEDEQAQLKFDTTNSRIKFIEEQLSIPYEI